MSGLWFTVCSWSLELVSSTKRDAEFKPDVLFLKLADVFEENIERVNHRAVTKFRNGSMLASVINDLGCDLSCFVQLLGYSCIKPPAETVMLGCLIVSFGGKH